MLKQSLQPIRGFRDLYPQDKALQNYVLEKLKGVALLCGFEEYDGPLLEPIELYLNKTSEELVKEQSYSLKDKNGQTLLLRPEMTPSLARMVAEKAGELIFPLRFFNIGLRYRYEAPQKGRSREFYQADFDILGSNSVLADAEILNAAVQILLSLGATEKDFTLCINSRQFMEKKLSDIGLKTDQIKALLGVIDKADKTDNKTFEAFFKKVGLPDSQITSIKRLIEKSVDPESDLYFAELFSLLKSFGIDTFCKINLNVVRGLDYYTGLVFEIKRAGEKGRSTIIGGGRYENLISTFNPKLQISGVGFAVSDVILLEFIKDIQKVPTLNSKPTKCLITVFSNETVNESIRVLQELRASNISSELYPETDKKLDKQLKYADRNKISYAVIIGPEEVKKNIVKLKNMQNGEQKELSSKELIQELS